MIDINSLNKETQSYEKFLKKITISGECWEMGGFKDKDGYAQFHIKRNTNKAHRISYEFHKGKIPIGLTIDHLCKNKCCVNPDRLEAVTAAENIRRADSEGIRKWFKNLSTLDKANFMKEKSDKAAIKKLAATHCARGHEWKTETTYIVPKTGHRRCNICFYNTPSMKNKKKGVY